MLEHALSCFFSGDVSSQCHAVDVGEAGAEEGGFVGADGDGHGAGVVELLVGYGGAAGFDQAHHVVHGEVGEGEGYGFHDVALFDYGFADGHAGCLAVGRYESGSAEFDASEVSDYYHDDVGESEGVDLPEYGFAGGTGGFAVIGAEVVGTSGAHHICPAYMAGVEVFLLALGDEGLGFGSALGVPGVGYELAHLLLEDGFAGGAECQVVCRPVHNSYRP